MTVAEPRPPRYRWTVSSAYAWTVYATMLTLLLAVIGLLANSVFRLEARIDALGRDLRAEMREMRNELRTEMHEGFAQVHNRLRLLERERG